MNLEDYSYVPDARAASAMPFKSSFSVLIFGVESTSPTIRMIRSGTVASQAPNST